jgi:hypothetical protein
MSNTISDLKSKNNSTVILINRKGMGDAEEALQQKLLGIYMKMLCENDFLPGAICFYADGVKLVVEGSPILDILYKLESKGIRLIICSTCLQYYGLAEKAKVGVIGGMHDIILAQWIADKVITL